jgi:hypothetical protein
LTQCFFVSVANLVQEYPTLNIPVTEDQGTIDNMEAWKSLSKFDERLAR